MTHSVTVGGKEKPQGEQQRRDTQTIGTISKNVEEEEVVER